MTNTDHAPATVGVIVPVRNRERLLENLLEALRQQTFRDFEVVVVDDASTDGSALVARTATIGAPVRVIDGHGNGAVAARSLALDHCDTPIVAFTDSDCVPDAQWLEQGVAAIAAGADAVNGRTVPTRAPRPLERTMESGSEGLYPTCNMFYRREVLDSVGGFDRTADRRWGFRLDSRAKGDGFGEDTVLAWSIARAGGRIDYARDAVVRHAVFPPDRRESLSRLIRVAAFPAMVKDVPELRSTLLRGRVVLGSVSKLWLYAAAGMAIGRSKRGTALALIGWTGAWAMKVRHRPAADRSLKVVGEEMAHEVVFSGALLVGNLRSRTIVL